MEKNSAGRGLIHLYSGDGKGKTTAAMGLCVRAAGHGMRVLICQFLKDGNSGERRAMENIPGITFMKAPEHVSFTFRMTPEEKRAASQYWDHMLEEAVRLADSGAYDMLLLDEAVYAAGAGMIDEDRLIRFLQQKPEKLEVVLTGRDPDDKLIPLCDYYSEIRCVKHPFDRGVQAREGIEY